MTTLDRVDRVYGQEIDGIRCYPGNGVRRQFFEVLEDFREVMYFDTNTAIENEDGYMAVHPSWEGPYRYVANFEPDMKAWMEEGPSYFDWIYATDARFSLYP